MILWVRIRSWHAIRADTEWTLCGRVIPAGEPNDLLPSGKSCESCLRIIARQADR